MSLTPYELATKLWTYARLQACKSEHRMQPVVSIPKLATILEVMVESAAEPLAKDMFEKMRDRKIEQLRKKLEETQARLRATKRSHDNLRMSVDTRIRNAVTQALKDD